jgi:hypothetical protein
MLPSPFPSLAAAGVHFRRGGVCMIAGVPGAGKSSVALVLALRCRVSTLYMSADSTAHTQAIRILANRYGKDQDEVETWLRDYPDWCDGQLEEAARHIRWTFDSAPSVEDVEAELDAYVTLKGEAPHLLIVDNLVDVSAGDGDEGGGLRALMKDLSLFARHYNTCVVVLHHVSESPIAKSEPCPPRSAIQWKVSQTPALVLTIAYQPEGASLWVAPVKNRTGPADASGKTAIQFTFDAGSMTLTDPRDKR